jgi:FkbM family methyltransferase
VIARRLRKLPYYARSVAALMADLRPTSWPKAIAPGRTGALELRSGLSFELSGLLDLLILKEVVHDDAYRLRELAGEAPRLIVDVGAGVGEFAVLAAVTFPEARVIAFEPDPGSFRLLEANVGRNGAANVEAHPVAVGLQPSYALRRRRARAYTSMHGSGPALAVAARPLEHFLRADTVDLVKVDCEGGEVDAIESLGAALARVRRVVSEYHLHLVPDEDRLLTELLAGHGFTVEVVPDRYDPALGYVYGTRRLITHLRSIV